MQRDVAELCQRVSKLEAYIKVLFWVNATIEIPLIALILVKLL